MTQNDADREAAGAIRTALYRECPDMPSYPIGIVEPILTHHREASTAALMAENQRLREELRRNLVMLEAIDRHNSTNFHEVRQRIVANRAALSTPSEVSEPEAIGDPYGWAAMDELGSAPLRATTDTIGGGEAETKGMSKCNRCGALWPSAPTGVVHKCQCSGGYCYPVATPQPSGDAVREAKEIAAAVVQSACESEPADPEHPDTIAISCDDLECIVRVQVELADERAALNHGGTQS